MHTRCPILNFALSAFFSLQVITTYALQKRLQNVSITVSAQEPGYVKTELARGWSDKGVLSFINKIGYNSMSHVFCWINCKEMLGRCDI